MRTLTSALATAALALTLAACATAPPPQPPAKPVRPAATTVEPAAPAPPEAPALQLIPGTFADLPGWIEGDHRPALQAFRSSCRALGARANDQPLSRMAPYGGTVGEWRAACAAAASATDPRAFFEAYFQPHRVLGAADAMRRVTGYYEPVVAVSPTPTTNMSEPFLAAPPNLVAIDLFALDEATGLAADIAGDVANALPDEFAAARGPIEAALNARVAKRFQTPAWGLVRDRRVVPPPRRAELDHGAGVLAYGRPCDVYDLQVQGSGRVRFPDGRDLRMAYAAQNGYGWNSIYGQLRARGEIASASKASVCAYLEAAGPEGARRALALDPSYVFFSLEPIGDPAAGPKGAQGVPLTPLGSVAVDPAFHPYGAVLYLDGGSAPVGRRLLVAQDTGGAIRRGPLRADVFFGTGDAAGDVALRQNAPADFWTLLPMTSAIPVAGVSGEQSG